MADMLSSVILAKPIFDEGTGEQKLQQLKFSSQLEIAFGNKGLGRRPKYRQSRIPF